MESPALEKKLLTEEETISFGRLISSSLRSGDIVKITGSLGAGKTTLVRGIVSGLGGDASDVHSPTFSLVHQYRTASIGVFHCDFYRLPDNSELEDLGGLEFFADDFLYLIEWPERVKLFSSSIPNRLLRVDLQHNAGGRVARLFGAWQIVD